MQKNFLIHKAHKSQYREICDLLFVEKLPTEDLNPELPDFFVAENNGKVVGVIGLEKYNDSALLRSMIVESTHRNEGIASRLVNELIQHAIVNDVKSLYLITNTAEPYFAKKGFIKIERDKVAPEVLQSKEFNGLCPASSTIMVKQL